MASTEGGCEAQAPTPIYSAFGGLRTEMDELDRRLTLLIERISPILGPSLPRNDQDCPKEEGGGSDITGKIRGFQSNIQGYINSIDNAISRLEI